MRRKLMMPSLFLLIPFVVAACTSNSGPTPVPTATPQSEAEATYLAGVADVMGTMQRSTQRFQETLGPIFPQFAPDEIQAKVLYNALTDADIHTTATEMLAAFELLTPPERFATDHAAFLAFLQSQADAAADIESAIGQEDLPHVHLGMAETVAGMGSTLVSLSGEYCRRITEGNVSPIGPGGPGGNIPPNSIDITLSSPFCFDNSTPGGEYGAAIARLSKTFTAEFGPRAGFPEGMTPEQLLTGLTYVQPAIVEVFERTLAELETIQPPAEYELGHQVFYDYFSELLSTARAIDRAVADGDHHRVQEEFGRSGEVAEAADARMPDEFRLLTPTIFQNEP